MIDKAKIMYLTEHETHLILIPMEFVECHLTKAGKMSSRTRLSEKVFSVDFSSTSNQLP